MNWKQLISNKRFGLEHCTKQEKKIEPNFSEITIALSSLLLSDDCKTRLRYFPFLEYLCTQSSDTQPGGFLCREIAWKRYSSQLITKASGIIRFSLIRNRSNRFGSLPCTDLGNPPFGHSGEKAIGTYFSEGKGLALKPLLSEAEWRISPISKAMQMHSVC